MFQDFAKKKFDDYLALLEFPAGRITFNQLRVSTLPPFIISFFEQYVPNKNIPMNKKDFEEILNKAIIFNINYIIRPKNTILKFVFGELETRPVHFIRERLKYFQFYGYYITTIQDFIAINSLEVVSSNQVQHIINDINKRLLEEVSEPGTEPQRMNLVKLLYYFFHDLGENNPINIKLPKKILSAYFQDKGYYDIKKRVDGFFSDEIFIQEALELMDPETKKSAAAKSDVDLSEEKVKEIVTRAKEKQEEEVKQREKELATPILISEEQLISVEQADDDLGRILNAEELMPPEIPEINIKIIREQEAGLPEIEKSRLVIDEEIYSDDLMFASQFADMTPPVQMTDKETRQRLIDDLFCESSHRKKIIKHIFRKDEDSFNESVNKILDLKSWQEAAGAIETLFKTNKVNFFSNEAVKFVDIMDSHFNKGKNN